MDAKGIIALHEEERRLWEAKDEIELTHRVAKRRAEREGPGLSAEDRAAAEEALAAARAADSAALSEWAAAYNRAKEEAKAYVQALGFPDPRLLGRLLS